MKYNTRFAPSPTGLAHVGNIRTALFDYLAAKSTGGKFFLRIEDTDRERFVPEAVDYIHQALDWLGLKSDGEVVYQSKRLAMYQGKVRELLDKDLAYKCFCTKERLDDLRQSQEKIGKPPIYDRRCLGLTKTEIREKEEKGESFVIRFRIPNAPEEIFWHDKVRGRVTIATDILEDFIILKSDGWPTYNLAHIIDDYEMGINLVVRGEEFVPSTPKYILVYRAFGWEPPEYAHMPLTLGKDHKKLSKRHGDTAILDYKEKGYLAETMINFLVLLGWNPGGGSTEEFFSLEELKEKFRIEDVNKAPAIFDLERLDWMNGVYIRNLSVKDLTDRLVEFDPSYQKVDREFLERVATVEQSRLKTLSEFKEISDFYFDLTKYEASLLTFKKSTPEATRKGLEASLTELKGNEWGNVEDFESILSKTVNKNQLTNADVYWPVRVALSGKDKSPSPAELLWVLGKDESLKRLLVALNKHIVD
ncbi:MAG: glutamate--tRNA ligase [Patescibacteria group bacterium]|jgi:glutamyl-tRNA synthetase|nr:glutamate--tRNA ligase [Patescibacteria group bacterium]